MKLKPLTILVADDEESIRNLVARWLTEGAHRVMMVGSATEAFAAMKKQQFDLVITDVLMPDGDGLDLIAAMKRSQPGARILAISGGGRYVERTDCLKMARGLGAHVVVMKPFTWAQLEAGMVEALAEPPATAG
jgi:DNA-binding NtrC family response regulator